MSRSRLQVLAATLLLAASVHAQSVEQCGTMANHAMLLQQDPAMAERLARIETHTQQFIAAGAIGADVVVTIPVVVHVVWNTAAENISDAQIQSQIQVLNEDFRRTNADSVQTRPAFSTSAADCEVQFCLATRDPGGMPTNGITRTQTATTSFGSGGNNVKFTSSGGRDGWPSSSYLNIWVCDLSSGLLGYAQFPGGAASTDGVVCDYAYFGRFGSAVAPFNLGRTASHEVGHWLNLRHIWGDSSSCGVDDFVADTPDSNAPTTGCPYSSTITQCGASVQYENYMDYTNDACMNMFTLGQKTRMHALFAAGGARASILSSQGCAPTASEYQVNQGNASVLVDGIQGTAAAPVIVSRCVGANASIQLTTNPGNIGQLYDVAISSLALVPASAGGITFPDGQIINVRLDAGLSFLSSGTAVPQLSVWSANQSLPYVATAPGTTSYQMIVFTPALPSGFALSQGVQIEASASSASFPAGPTGDDSSVTVSVGGATCISAIPFYGTSYTQCAVTSNGRVGFGPPDTDFSPSLNEARNDAPFVGFWTDLNPSVGGGSITISSPAAGVLRVHYANVRYYGQTAACTFSIDFDSITGAVTLGNLLSIPPNPSGPSSGTRQFLGISRGNTGAVDLGSSNFAPGASGVPGNPNAMLYQFYDNTGGGLVPALASTSLDRLVFTPSGSGYAWAGF